MRLAVIGNSHIQCLIRAYQNQPSKFPATFDFLQLNDPSLIAEGSSRTRFEDFDLAKVGEFTDSIRDADLTVLLLRGNEHSIAALLDTGQPIQSIERRIETNMQRHMLPWLKLFHERLPGPVAIMPPPPPIESEAHIRENPSAFRAKLAESRISPVATRLHAWRHQVVLLRQLAAQFGLPFIDLPQQAFAESGCLNEIYTTSDPTHGNADFGKLLLTHLCAQATTVAAQARARAGPANKGPGRQKLRHPYDGLPDRAFWRESVARVEVGALDPVADVPFRISREDKVATAGSCFAQHISKRIRKSGFHFLVTEQPQANAAGDAQARGFYDFSARFGNVYTSRQLLQLFDRAYGYFTPVDDHWKLEDGTFCDPFRPRIEPDGFPSVKALREDRRAHLAAVRRMFEQLDIFVFTLGLTECWVSRLDGAAYPIAPGVAGGTFDARKHAFLNLTVEEIVTDLRAFLAKLRLVNPAARIVLTVSPVPLAATYEPEHVLVATTYSKSVLRVAAETIERSSGNVFYFPSYEIINGSYNRGAYFHDDLRSVTDEGVSHVMQVFMRRMTDEGAAALPPDAGSAQEDAEAEEMEALADAACDEALLANR